MTTDIRGLLSFCLLIEVCSAIGSEFPGEEGWPAGMMSDEDRLFEELFRKRHYNRYSRPVINANESLSISMGTVIARIVEVNELDEVFRINMWLKINWKDPKLTWEPSDYGGLTKISVPANLVWVPDIVLFDSSENGVKLDDNHLLVDANGSMDWFPKAIFASYCHIDIALFPFDEQRCVLRFESWSYDTSKLNLILRQGQPLLLDYYKNNSEWDLIGTSAKRVLIKYPCCEMPYSDIEFCLHIRRRVLFYGYILILPCSLISVLTAFTFVLPPQSTDRIGLGITTLLALIVNQLVVADRVPPTSDALPLIGLYFGCVMIMNTLSVISMVCVSNMYNRSSVIYAMPPWMQHLVCNRLGHLLRLRRPLFDKDRKGTENGDPCATLTADQKDDATRYAVYVQRCDTICSNQQQRQPRNPSVGSEEYDDWKYAALVIDRLCFCTCVTYLMTVTVFFYTYAIMSRI